MPRTILELKNGVNQTITNGNDYAAAGAIATLCLAARDLHIPPISDRFIPGKSPSKERAIMYSGMVHELGWDFLENLVNRTVSLKLDEAAAESIEYLYGGAAATGGATVEMFEHLVSCTFELRLDKACAKSILAVGCAAKDLGILRKLGIEYFENMFDRACSNSMGDAALYATMPIGWILKRSWFGFYTEGIVFSRLVRKAADAKLGRLAMELQHKVEHDSYV